MLTKRQQLTKALKRLQLLPGGRRGTAGVVFVLGEMRSGTNMLAQALERHERVECYHENDDEAFDSYVLRPPEVIAGLVQRSRARRVVFKSIADMGRADDLVRIFPGAKVIFLFRRYEDVVNSALRSFRQHNEYLRLILHDEQAAGWRKWGLSGQHMEWIRHYYEQGITDASARALIWYVRNDAFVEQGLIKSGVAKILNYESLVQDPHAHFCVAARFIGLEFSPKMSRGVVSTSVRRQAAPEIHPAIAGLCSELFSRMSKLAAERQTADSGSPCHP